MFSHQQLADVFPFFAHKAVEFLKWVITLQKFHLDEKHQMLVFALCKLLNNKGVYEVADGGDQQREDFVFTLKTFLQLSRYSDSPSLTFCLF